jgi:CRP-like cAMP-binding protein
LFLKNLLLGSLPQTVFGQLKPHLQPVRLEQGQILFESGDSVDFVYFPEDAIISLVVTLLTGEAIEAAMVGRDGVVAASAALNGKISLSRAICQIGGTAFSCDADVLKRAAMQNEALHSLLIRHEQTVYAQAQQSAACNATHHVEARLSRWLLRARDLSGNDTLPFTQEFLAEMLGVGRPTVSMAAHTLQMAGVLRYTRGKIQITNVDGIQDCACECYRTIKGHYARLLGVKD